LKAKGQIEVTADGTKKAVEAKISFATGGRSRGAVNETGWQKVIGYREAMSLPQQPK
jgi:dihydrolipoamide dehydrogenase